MRADFTVFLQHVIVVMVLWIINNHQCVRQAWCVWVSVSKL